MPGARWGVQSRHAGAGPITPSIHLPFPPVRALRRFTVRAQLPPALAPLQTLATNLRWSWHPPTLDLFATLDPEAWERAGHDPVRLLGEIPTARLAELAADAETVVTIRELADDLAEYLAEPRWYQGERDDDPALPAAIGYFSMEFGVSEVLPNYSGGLGVLAGDHLKASSDLGLPLIGVGLLYRSGYFRQSLSLDGWQLETYPVLDPQGLPLQLLVDEAGEQVLVEIAMPAREDAQGTRLAGRRRAGAAAAARLRHRGERPRPARRHRPPLRRRPGPAHPSGDPRRYRRGAGRPRVLRDHRPPAARGLPHQRGTRGLPRPRAHPGAVREPGPLVRRGARHRARRHRLHHAHAGARRHRPVPGRHGAPLLPPGPAAGRTDRPGARARRGGQPQHVQHGPHGPAPRPTGQRRVEAARRGVPRHVRRPLGGLRRR